jgi:hypothetical protein
MLGGWWWALDGNERRFARGLVRKARERLS